MARQKHTVMNLASVFTMAATSTSTVYMDLIDADNPQVLVTSSHASTSAAAGLTASIYPGFASSAGLTADTAVYADNGNTISEFTTNIPTLNSSSLQTKRTAFAISASSYPIFVKLVLTNTDPVNSVSVSILGDW